MKRLINRIPEVLFLILLLLLVVDSTLLAQQKSRKPKIGLCLDDYNVDRWYQDRDFFINKVEALGGEVLLEVAYSETDAQIKQIRKLIDEGVKVLVIVPTGDGSALAEVIALAKKKKIKVIAYDRMIMQAELDYYISHDSEMVGELMATYMLSARPQGDYAILSGPDTDVNALMCKRGQMRVLQPAIDRGDVRLVYDDKVGEWTEMEAMMMMDGFLSQHSGPLDVVLAANDGLASGVIIALQQHERNGKVMVSGQDADLAACRLIYKGEQAMTVYKPIRELAYKAAEVAMALARNKQPEASTRSLNNGKKEVSAILFAPIAVDKQNMAETVLKDQSMSLKDVKDR